MEKNLTKWTFMFDESTGEQKIQAPERDFTYPELMLVVRVLVQFLAMMNNALVTMEKQVEETNGDEAGKRENA